MNVLIYSARCATAAEAFCAPLFSMSASKAANRLYDAL